MSRTFSFRKSLLFLRDRRFLVVFLIGFSSGFPWALHGSVLTLWMQSEGLSRSAIGYIGAVASIYALNWLWSPLVDKWRLPWLSCYFDQRRSWIILTQIVIVLALLLLSRTEPSVNLWIVGLCALLVSLASATQDIAVDAYRIKLFKSAEMDSKIPYASALATAGWWSGYGFLGGALMLWLGGESVGLEWPVVYWVAAAIYIVLLLLVAICPEPEPDDHCADEQATPAGEPLSEVADEGWRQWLVQHLLRPFIEFFQRCGLKLGLVILLFLVSFRLGEAMLGRMSLVFYVELGFSTEQLALYQKFFGGLTTVVFALLGAVINAHYGVIRGMMIGGIAMASSNLLYAVMAQVGPEPWLFVLTLLVDNFTGAFATVAVMSFMSYFASRTYTGTQFALMTSISNFGRTTLAAGSGVLVDSLGGNWSLFFILTALAVIPGLLLLIWVSKLVTQHSSAAAA